jgi:hypothetical protein
MNNKIKLVRLVVAATFGSLLWAGCASPDRDYATIERNRPVDLTKFRADTHPEWGTGIDRESAYGTVNVPVDNTPIYDAAGAERIRP